MTTRKTGDASVLRQLMRTIEDRKQQPPTKPSYTVKLLQGGTQAIGKKIREEAGEVVDAAEEPGTEGKAHLVREAADLIYHLWVMLASREISLDDVEGELARRFGTSGIEEKASRSSRKANET